MINDYEATKPMTTDAYVPSTDFNDDTISTLNGLISICKDGEEGFREAADGIERTDLKSLFQEYSGQRAVFAGELQTLVQTLGGVPETSGNVSAMVHRAWLGIKAAVTGGDETAILSECEMGEDYAKKAYIDAQATELPDYVRETVQNQYSSVLSAHDRIKALRDSAKTKSSTASTN